ncbi:MAG: NADH-quinone oxidoreductase subunit C [Firmicutes bacterium]|nr:NADH-quinone oxidoreductase subunit C [Bacillota bacterium]
MDEETQGAAEGGANAARPPEGARPRPASGSAAAPGTAGAARGGAAAAAPAAPPALPPELQRLFDRVKEQLPDVERDERVHGALGLRVAPERAHAVLAALRDMDGVRCNYLSNLAAVDWKDAIEVAYHLFNLDDPSVRIVVKVRLPYQGDEEPEVDSVTDIWPTANWHEREAYDLLGVRFRGHPDLRRILLPETYQGGHPLRKSFVDRRPKRQRLVRPR